MRLTERVKEHLAECDLKEVRGVIVAEAMGKSKAAFYAKLTREGANYHSLLIDERKRRCLELMAENPSPPTTFIMRRCGYTTTKGARMAFEKWFGMTPAEFRRISAPTNRTCARRARALVIFKSARLEFDRAEAKIVARCKKMSDEQAESMAVWAHSVGMMRGEG